MELKFEVGKKYKHTVFSNAQIVECVHVNLSCKTMQVVMKSLKNGSIFILSGVGELKYWAEVREKERGKMWVNIYKYRSDKPFDSCSFSSRETADVMSTKRVACIEVDWEEGQGL